MIARFFFIKKKRLITFIKNVFFYLNSTRGIPQWGPQTLFPSILATEALLPGPRRFVLGNRNATQPAARCSPERSYRLTRDSNNGRAVEKERADTDPLSEA